MRGSGREGGGRERERERERFADGLGRMGWSDGIMRREGGKARVEEILEFAFSIFLWLTYLLTLPPVASKILKLVIRRILLLLLLSIG